MEMLFLAVKVRKQMVLQGTKLRVIFLDTQSNKKEVGLFLPHYFLFSFPRFHQQFGLETGASRVPLASEFCVVKWSFGSN